MSARQPVELPSHEVLSQLARDDPHTYEALRQEVIERFIESAPARIKPRLCGIQFRVDSVRRLSRSTLGSTVAVYELMWESFLRLNHTWQEVIHLKEGYMDTHAPALASEYSPVGSARILEFRPRSSRNQN